MALGKERQIKKIARTAMGREKMARGMIASIAGVLGKLKTVDTKNIARLDPKAGDCSLEIISVAG